MATDSTGTIRMSGPTVRHHHAIVRPRQVREYPYPMAVTALLVLLVAAWGGLAPFIGPSFGYSGDGGSSLHWDLARAVLGVLPALGGVAASLLILASCGALQLGRGSPSSTSGGVLALLSGAWFALGWAAWNVLNGHPYLLGGAGLHLAFVAGLAVGPGALLMTFGALVLGYLAGARGRFGDEGSVFVGAATPDEQVVPKRPQDAVGSTSTALRDADPA